MKRALAGVCGGGVFGGGAWGQCEPHWAAVPSVTDGALGSAVLSMAWADADGAGPGGAALYAAGLFDEIGGVAATNIARWNGVSWAALGAGLSVNAPLQYTPSVRALEVFDDGGWPALYAGGKLHQAGGVETPHIARWDGAAWSAVGGGVTKGLHGVLALAVFDEDGAGPSSAALFVGGEW